MADSLATKIARLDKTNRNGLLRAFSDEELEAIASHWKFHARPEQIPPKGDWRYWLIMAGRGFGKTRAGAEWTIEQAQTGPIRIALVGATAADVRDTMIEGESGILACSPDSFMPEYEPSKRRLTWPNGARATSYTAEKPRQLRGPQHHRAWCDELAAWQYPEAWDQLMFGMRLGDDPRVCITTTPRPKQMIRDLVANKNTVITRGSTYENKANLAAAFIDAILEKYEGTTLGQQELHAQLLDEVPGALWTRGLIDRNRVTAAPELYRCVVALDPSVTAKKTSDETGIILAGVTKDRHGYVMGDASGIMTTDRWAKKAVWLFHESQASRIVAEVNNGGDLVEAVLRQQDNRVPVKMVRASQGKYARAEPIAALYEQGRVHHVGVYGELEDQMCNFTPDADWSPDRLDALVWGLWDLMIQPREARATWI